MLYLTVNEYMTIFIKLKQITIYFFYRPFSTGSVHSFQFFLMKSPTYYRKTISLTSLNCFTLHNQTNLCFEFDNGVLRN